MRSLRIAALFMFLLGQALWVTYGSPRQYLPAVPDFNQFARQLGGWKMEREDPIDPDTLRTMQSDATLSRIYTENGSPWSAQLLIAWFQTQQGGQKQPHSPKVCLPASGWAPLKSDVLRTGGLDVNRYIVTRGKYRDVVLYWFQTPFRTETSEWAAKFWGMSDSLRYGRTDTALVRVVVPVSTSDEVASAAAVRFLQSARTELERRIPK